MNRPTGRTKSCNPSDIGARLKDAADFLEAAELLSQPGKGDVVATNAIHSAVASADVICCPRLGFEMKPHRLAATTPPEPVQSPWPGTGKTRSRHA